jgi:hypothetical protein
MLTIVDAASFLLVVHRPSSIRRRCDDDEESSEIGGRKTSNVSVRRCVDDKGSASSIASQYRPSVTPLPFLRAVFETSGLAFLPSRTIWVLGLGSWVLGVPRSPPHLTNNKLLI